MSATLTPIKKIRRFTHRTSPNGLDAWATPRLLSPWDDVAPAIEALVEKINELVDRVNLLSPAAECHPGGNPVVTEPSEKGARAHEH